MNRRSDFSDFSDLSEDEIAIYRSLFSNKKYVPISRDKFMDSHAFQDGEPLSRLGHKISYEEFLEYTSKVANINGMNITIRVGDEYTMGFVCGLPHYHIVEFRNTDRTVQQDFDDALSYLNNLKKRTNQLCSLEKKRLRNALTSYYYDVENRNLFSVRDSNEQMEEWFDGFYAKYTENIDSPLIGEFTNFLDLDFFQKMSNWQCEGLTIIGLKGDFYGHNV